MHKRTRALTRRKSPVKKKERWNLFHPKHRPIHGMILGTALLLLKNFFLLAAVAGALVFLVSFIAFLKNYSKSQ